ncbi:hypothetical protein HPB47_024469 [Ixodes persulcatus]|uniref:Uncharacterized protein n=1 Tax=Ixodes persulcatus TaxID=34615 RepID=A0AC60Q6B5_IXOPE|nr:hypothetical protein HPB47_024469 [Ixodes persulcatus]
MAAPKRTPTEQDGAGLMKIDTARRSGGTRAPEARQFSLRRAYSLPGASHLSSCQRSRCSPEAVGGAPLHLAVEEQLFFPGRSWLIAYTFCLGVVRSTFTKNKELVFLLGEKRVLKRGVAISGQCALEALPGDCWGDTRTAERGLRPVRGDRGCLEEEDAWRVRVTVYDAQRPHLVSSPESPSLDLMSVPVAMATPPPHDVYLRQQSDSGLDNPFRPDGELSKEADTIVSLIKEGKPITPVKGEADGFLGDQGDGSRANGGGDTKVAPSRAPGPLGAERRQDTNGSTPASLKKGLVEVQHGIVVPPSDPSTVEQVMIKKKPKCKCCVIQ